ncbi:hypothetical protein [Haliovirga abyssi]|uniref:Uncharacterized protein n=1 Tax=Haliovirga abyssi TaxID=2996794 RepID=A0AAU9DBU0_9FUSO|nr:hypothetical protein [Haliovirga abyssi]BDU49583.1 hypothetical protein HLVA_01520 [Haliovirga abyssi]
MAEIFGKEIDIDVKIDEKGIMALSIVASIILIAATGYFIIYPKVIKITQNKQEVKKKNQEIVKVEKAYKSIKSKYDLANKIYSNQKDKLEILNSKFANSSLKNETDLKIAIQKFIDYFKLDILKTGSVQIDAKEIKIEPANDKDKKIKIYKRMYIPYTVQGNLKDITTFFYYLENSKWLLTFKKSDLSIKKLETKNMSQDTGKIEVNFKVGAYVLEKVVSK